MKNKSNNSRGGFSFLDLMLVVASLVGVGAILLPMLARSHRHPPGMHCTNNLKQVGLAFRIWAGDNNDKMPMQVSVMNGGALELTGEVSAYATFLVMSNELNTPKILFCPEDQTPNRQMATYFGSPTSPAPDLNNGAILLTATNNLSYFVGLDATDVQPSTILSGDDHFNVRGAKPSPGLFLLQTNAPVEWRDERHRKQGNIGLADGSVMGVSTYSFRQLLIQTGQATNRLAMP